MGIAAPWVPFVVAISLIISFVLVIQILGKEQAGNRVTWILLSSLALIMAWIITTYIQLDFVTVEIDPFIFAVVATIGNLSSLAALILLANFFRLLVEPYPSALQNIYLFSLSALLLGFAIASIFAGFNSSKELVEFYWVLADIINVFFDFSIVLFIMVSLRTLLKEQLSEKQRKQVLNIRNGLLIGLIGTIPFLFLQMFVDRAFFAIVLFLITISLFFFSRAYLVEPRVAFILPHRAYLMIVVTKSGSLKYSRNFLLDSADADSSTSLVSVGLTAINTLLSEFYQDEVQPTYIVFKERKIMFHWSESFYIAVFTDRNSMLIRHAMERTVKGIEEKYAEKLEEVLKSPVEMKIDDLVGRTFNFIY